MYQPKKENLHTCNTDIKRIGHNLDTSKLSYSVEDICERQISYSVSLPQTKNNTLNHHTLYFEAPIALHTYQFCAPSFAYLKEKTILKETGVDFVFHSNGNSKANCFQSNPEIQKFKIDQTMFSIGEMSPFET